MTPKIIQTDSFYSMRRSWYFLILIALIIAFPLVTKSYFIKRVGIIVAIYAMNTTGMTLLVRYAGVVSLGHAGFYALGAYLSAFFALKLGINVWLSMMIAGSLTVSCAYVFSIPFLRLRLVYLALATLCFGEVIYLLAKELAGITGGVNGIPGIPYLQIGQIVLKEDWQIFYFIGGLTVFLVFFTDNIGKSRFGRAFHAIRTNEIAAQTMGINVQRELSSVFCLSALLTGLSGSLLAHFITFISPDSFMADFSITLLIIVLIGGANVWGGLVTAVVLTAFSEVFRGFQDFSMGCYGLLFILALILFPGGLATLFKRDHGRKRIFSNASPLFLPAAQNTSNLNTGFQTLRPNHGNLLEAINISKDFGGTRALSNVNFSVGYDKILGIIGPNGAGKTTLLNVINGFFPPREGRIIFKGQDVTGEKPNFMAGFGLCRTFQIVNLFRGLTVIENVMVGGHIKARTGMLLTGLNVARSRREEATILNRATRSLEFLGLANRAYDLVESLPYGEQKLIELARALAMEPVLLLLDEPACGLNPMETKTLSDILHQIRESGVTIILVEHNMNLIMSVSDTVLVLDFGKSIAFGTPNEVHKNKEVIRAYLGRKE